METEQLPTEEELVDILRDDVGLFIKALYEYYAEKITTHLRKVSLDVLNDYELADALQETMFAVWQRVKQEDFEPDRPLRMVFRIARNKGVDSRRKKLGCRHAANETDVTDLVISDMVGSNLALAVKYQSEDETRRFDETLPELVGELPEQQRAAATAFLNCYEDFRHGEKWERLATDMRALTGKRVTVAAATSALRASLAKIREELIRRGFEFVEGRLI